MARAGRNARRRTWQQITGQGVRGKLLGGLTYREAISRVRVGGIERAENIFWQALPLTAPTRGITLADMDRALRDTYGRAFTAQLNTPTLTFRNVGFVGDPVMPHDTGMYIQAVRNEMAGVVQDIIRREERIMWGQAQSKVEWWVEPLPKELHVVEGL